MKSCSRHGAVEVLGSIGNHYTVAFDGADTTCTCPGYHHRQSCRHVPLGRDLRCTWSSQDELAEQISGSCPRCGAATVDNTQAVSTPTGTGSAVEPRAVTVMVTVAA